jgi:polyisoprenoid-binding protein YceI
MPAAPAAGCLALALVLGTGGAGRAIEPSPEGSTLRFTASQMGTPLQGQFARFSAQVNFDPLQPKAATVQARVDLASVDAGAPEANMLLRSAGFFDTAHFAEARFEASDFSDEGGGHYRARGTFSLKGHTASLPIAFTRNRDAHGFWFDGSFTVSRLAFSIGEGEWADTGTLDDPVLVRFHLHQDSVR